MSDALERYGLQAVITGARHGPPQGDRRSSGGAVARSGRDRLRHGPQGPPRSGRSDFVRRAERGTRRPSDAQAGAMADASGS